MVASGRGTDRTAESVEDFAGVGDYQDSFVLAVFVVGDFDIGAGHVAEIDFLAAFL